MENFKIDILKIFCFETFIIGVLAGVLGVCFSYVLKEPINSFVQNLVKENVEGGDIIQIDKASGQVTVLGKSLSHSGDYEISNDIHYLQTPSN